MSRRSADAPTTGRPVAVAAVPAYAQGDARWAAVPVGEGREPFSAVGCMVTSLTAAAGALGTSTSTPPQANDAIKAAGGFSGTSLILTKAAATLGLRAVEGERIRAGQGTRGELRAALDDTLDRGGLALVHVDYDTASPTANHFILCFARDADGAYLCHDVAGPAAKVIKLAPATLDVQRTPSRRYTAAGVAPLWRAGSVPAEVARVVDTAAGTVGGRGNLLLLVAVVGAAWWLSKN